MEHNFTFSQRVERLKDAMSCGWAEVGQRLDVSRTLLHQLRKGKAEPSEKLLRRLVEAEMDTGVRKRPAERGHGVIHFLMTNPSERQVQIGTDQNGVSKATVKLYFRGVPPLNAPAEIELRAPKDISTAAGLMVRVLIDDDVETLVLECLPAGLASKDFLTVLSPHVSWNSWEHPRF